MNRSIVPSHRNRVALLLAILLTAAVLSGCSSTTEKSEFAGPDWSRGIELGTANINNRPGIVWDARTKSSLVAWLAHGEKGWQIQYARVNDRGEIAASAALPFTLRLPTRYQMIQDDQGILHLLWLEAVSGERPGLYHAQITTDGDVLNQPKRLSSPSSDVTGYSALQAIPGALDLFWSDVSGGASELYHARLTSSGETAVAPHALGVSGADPSGAADSSGTVHLTWHQTHSLGSEQILYATFDPQTQQVSAAVPMAAFPMSTGLALYPPEIGLELDRVYVFWSLEQRGGGLSPGTAQLLYRSFPMGKPEEQIGGTLLFPATARPDYEAASGDFNYQALFGLGFDDGGVPIVVRGPADYSYMQYSISGQRGEVGLLLASFMALPRRPGKIQIAFAVLEDGHLKGYEVAARTAQGSLRPIAAVDDQGAVHLAWLSLGGFGAYDVYYASTAPSVRTALNRVTSEDVVDSALGQTWTTASALAFFPLLVVWLFLPFAWLVGFYLFRPDSDLTTTSGRVGLVVALALYMFSKLFMLPAFLWYAPFMDIISPKYELLVLLGVPAIILGLGLLAMRQYIRRADRKVVLFAFAIFAGVDSILSLVLYMPNAMGG